MLKSTENEKIVDFYTKLQLVFTQYPRKNRTKQKPSAKWQKALCFYRRDFIGKPSSVVYDHLSSPAVADGIKPPFNGARRADALSPAPIGVASDRVYMAVRSRALR